ncbi:hypothetical protein HZS_191 [Henneguya salminicola]|nr:hypothetical protein HZS_191 [Henneguya salminicola]
MLKIKREHSETHARHNCLPLNIGEFLHRRKCSKKYKKKLSRYFIIVIASSLFLSLLLQNLFLNFQTKKNGETKYRDARTNFCSSPCSQNDEEFIKKIT